MKWKERKEYGVKRDIRIIKSVPAGGKLRKPFGANTHYVLRKRKDGSEGETKSLEDGAENQGELCPGLESEPRSRRFVSRWISELLRTRESYAPHTSHFAKKKVYCSYLRPVPPV